jgi:TatD DNase family protein
MYLIDTHTHIYTDDFDGDIPEIIQRAKREKVNKYCLPNIDIESITRVNALCARYPESCFPMMGLHPSCVNADYKKKLTIIQEELTKRNYIAIGEIGIDLYWDKTFINEQIAAFEEQLQWSKEKNLPVSIHSRDAFPHVFESIYKIGKEDLRGVFHSFGGNPDELKEALKCTRFMIGINGVVTFKNAELRKFLNIVPLERIVLETDAPYLTPVPFRGKRNEPAHLIYIAQKLAEIFKLPLETVMEKTTENANRLFF